METPETIPFEIKICGIGTIAEAQPQEDETVIKIQPTQEEE